MVEGYKADELVLSIGQRLASGASSYPIRPGWTEFNAVARKLMKYDYVDEFSEGLAVVELRGKLGFINQAGDLVIGTKYDKGCVCGFSEGLAVIKRNDKWGFVDKNGNEVVPPQYEKASSFKNGLAVVTKNQKEGMIDKSGRVVIPFKYEHLLRESEGLIGASLNGKVGFINRSGVTVIPFEYDNASIFSEGLAPVESKKQWGFIDKRGKVVIAIKYDYAGCFSDGLAAVGIGVADFPDGGMEYKMGLVNKRGELLRLVPLNPEELGSALEDHDGDKYLDYYYGSIDRFSEGLAVAYRHGKQGFINTRGIEVVPLKYDGCDCGEFSSGIGMVNLDNKFGFVDRTGVEVVSIKYDEIWCDGFRRDGFIGVKLNGKKGFVDLYGNEYWDL